LKTILDRLESRVFSDINTSFDLKMSLVAGAMYYHVHSTNQSISKLCLSKASGA
jgi:hypothetical protein